MSTLLGKPGHILIHVINQPIVWQQCNAYNHADTGQELQLMFTSTIRMGKKVIKVTLTVELNQQHVKPLSG